MCWFLFYSNRRNNWRNVQLSTSKDGYTKWLLDTVGHLHVCCGSSEEERETVCLIAADISRQVELTHKGLIGAAISH